MPATPADIVRATRQARTVTRVDAVLQAAQPDARDGLSAPDPGYFRDAADAAAALTLKAALVGAERRRWGVGLAGEYWVDPVAGIPSFDLAVSEEGDPVRVMLARMEIDLETETTAFEVFG